MAKLKTETSRAKQGFEDYYALGATRSLEKLHQKYTDDTPNPPTGSMDTLKLWSNSFRWQDRLREREQRISRETEIKLVDRITEMRVRQAEVGEKLQQKGLQRLQELVGEEITPSEARAMVIEGAKLERIARGEPEGGAVDISILLSQAKEHKELNLIVVSENIFKQAMEGKTEEVKNDGALSLPKGVSGRSEPVQDSEQVPSDRDVHVDRQ